MGVMISYVAIFLELIVSFLYTPWMIKQIGPSNYGLYSLILTFLSYFIMDFGLSMSIQRFIAKYRAEGNERMVSNMIGLTTKIYLFIDTIIFLVLFVLYFYIEGIFTGLTAEEMVILKQLYLIAALFSVASFLFKPMNGAMMAYEYFVENKLLDMVQRIGTVLIICIALFCGAGVYVLVLTNGMIALAVSIIKFIIFMRKSKVKIKWSYFNKKEFKEITAFSIWAFGRDLAQKFKISLAPSILGVLSNSYEISYFALGMTLEATIWSLSSAINGLFLPKVTRIAKANSTDELNDLMLRIGRIELYIITLVYFGFAIFGRQFLTLWVGSEFIKVYYVVLFLTFTHLISLTQYIAENMVYVKNRIKDTVIILLICSFVGLVVGAFLASKYGSVGCAFGTFLGLLMTQFFYNMYYKKNFEINIISFFRSCHMSIMPVLLLVSAPFFLATIYINLNSWLYLLVGILLYILVYGLVCYYFLFNSSEQALIKNIIRK